MDASLWPSCGRLGPVIIEGQTEYEIEVILADKLLDSQHPKKGKQYLVKWAGYPLLDATWDPECNLQEDILDLFQAYHQDCLPKKHSSFMKARDSKPLRHSSISRLRTTLDSQPLQQECAIAGWDVVQQGTS